jgi:hypothetical protein
MAGAGIQGEDGLLTVDYCNSTVVNSFRHLVLAGNRVSWFALAVWHDIRSFPDGDLACVTPHS